MNITQYIDSDMYVRYIDINNKLYHTLPIGYSIEYDIQSVDDIDKSKVSLNEQSSNFDTVYKTPLDSIYIGMLKKPYLGILDRNHQNNLFPVIFQDVSIRLHATSITMYPYIPIRDGENSQYEGYEKFINIDKMVSDTSFVNLYHQWKKSKWFHDTILNQFLRIKGENFDRRLNELKSKINVFNEFIPPSESYLTKQSKIVVSNDQLKLVPYITLAYKDASTINENEIIPFSSRYSDFMDYSDSNRFTLFQSVNDVRNVLEKKKIYHQLQPNLTYAYSLVVDNIVYKAININSLKMANELHKMERSQLLCYES